MEYPSLKIRGITLKIPANPNEPDHSGALFSADKRWEGIHKNKAQI
jgi:hypothetical protein